MGPSLQDLLKLVAKGMSSSEKDVRTDTFSKFLNISSIRREERRGEKGEKKGKLYN